MAIAPQLPQLVEKKTFATRLTNNTVIEYKMAQSAVHSRNTPLHIDAFWEKPTITPPPFVGQRDTTVEFRIVGERGDTIGDIAKRTTLRGHVPT